MGSITRGEDGVYRWIFKKSLYKDPSILFTVWKIFGLIILGIWIFLVLISLGNYRFLWEGFRRLSLVFVLLGVGMILLSSLGYLLYALIMGGYYCVEFEMDDAGVLHRQRSDQTKKAKALGIATAMAGAAVGRPGTAGAGLLAASRTESYTRFDSVRSVKLTPKHGIIRLNEPLNKNQVYANPEDFAFVVEFIRARVNCSVE